MGGIRTFEPHADENETRMKHSDSLRGHVGTIKDQAETSVQ